MNPICGERGCRLCIPNDDDRDRCNCPPGMWHHAFNCPDYPGEQQASHPDAPRTAMTLTEQEWQDLADMVAGWKAGFMFPPNSDIYRRKVALADRIIEATR